MEQNCFVIIKPDALERGLMGMIITRIENMNLRIYGICQRHKTRSWAAEHYVHVAHLPMYSKMIDFMTARSVISFIVTGPSAIQRLRSLAGASANPDIGTIRGDYGYSFYNLIHVSDSEESAERELKLFHQESTDQCTTST